MKKKWALLLAVLVVVLLLALLCSSFSLPSKAKMAKWAESPLLSDTVDALRQMDEDELYFLTLYSDGSLHRSHSHITDSLQEKYAQGDWNVDIDMLNYHWTNEPELSAIVNPVFAKYHFSSILVAYDNAGSVSVIFTSSRKHLSDDGYSSHHLVWIDDGYTGIRKGEQSLVLNTGVTEDILQFNDDNELLISDHWYYWSTSVDSIG